MANVFTLGLYGAIYVVVCANQIGARAGKRYPKPLLAAVLTIVTLGIYPGVMLSVLAFDLGKSAGNSIGIEVLALNVSALALAFMSGGLAFVLSVALWAHACWRVVETEALVISAIAPNHSLQGRRPRRSAP